MEYRKSPLGLSSVDNQAEQLVLLMRRREVASSVLFVLLVV
jgi:hypothetical protein